MGKRNRLVTGWIKINTESVKKKRERAKVVRKRKKTTKKIRTCQTKTKRT